MTSAQRQAIVKAWNLLSEHFEHVLLGLDWCTEQDDDVHVIYWHGGAIPALGLGQFAIDGINRSGKRVSEPGEGN